MTDPDDHREAIRREAGRGLAAITSGATLRALLDTVGRYDEAYWRHCGAQGWTAIGLPEAHGGVGLGLAELCIVAETAGALAVGAPFLETGFAAGQALLRDGGAALRARWLPALAAGSAIATVSIAEGAEILPARPAVGWRDGRLHGRLAAVPAAAVADLAVLRVATDRGPALAAADLRRPGVKRRAFATFDNSRCAADLGFEAAEAELLTEPGDAGNAACARILDLQAVVAAHQQLGGAARVLALAREHALTRRAFGQPIGAFQSVKHRIAENWIALELARAGAGDALARLGEPGFGRAAMAARLLATEAYETAARDAIQLHGGMGVAWEGELHLHQRRSRSLALELGSVLAWEDRLADDLAGEDR